LTNDTTYEEAKYLPTLTDSADEKQVLTMSSIG